MYLIAVEGLEIDSKPIMDEVHMALPYVRPEHRNDFDRRLLAEWDTGTFKRTFRHSGKLDEYIIDPGRKLDRLEAVELISNRFAFSIYRLRNGARLQRAIASGQYRFASLTVAEAYCCRKAFNRRGKPVRLNKLPELPLKGCKAPFCSCSWRIRFPEEDA